MSAVRIIALFSLIALVLSIAAVGDALAGEKAKGRIFGQVVKWEQVEVGDQEGHVVTVAESKAIHSIIQGTIVSGVHLYRVAGLYDMNLKTGEGSEVAYAEGTDQEGNKYYVKIEGKLAGGTPTGRWSFIKGTGKWEGIRGGGTWSGVNLSQTQWYVDWEGEVALSGR